MVSSNLDYCCDHTSNCCDTAVGKSWVTLPGKPITKIDSAHSTATLNAFYDPDDLFIRCVSNLLRIDRVLTLSIAFSLLTTQHRCKRWH
jgi:hypothetical protein